MGEEPRRVVERAGVHSVVYLSAFVVDLDSSLHFAYSHGKRERLFEESNLSWTFLRANCFVQNALTSSWVGRLRGTTLIASDDDSAVATKVLTEEV